MQNNCVQNVSVEKGKRKKKYGYFPVVEISTEFYLELWLSAPSDAHHSATLFSLENVSAFTADTTQGALVVGTLVFFFFLKDGNVSTS